MTDNTELYYVNSYPRGEWISEGEMERFLGKGIPAEKTLITLQNQSNIDSHTGQSRRVPDASRGYKRDVHNGQPGWRWVGRRG